MTNQEIEKRFEEKFPFELWHEGGLVSKNDDILAFIQSEINLALANRNKELFGKIKDYDFKEKHSCRFNDGKQDCDCFIDGLNVALSLITKRQ